MRRLAGGSLALLCCLAAVAAAQMRDDWEPSLGGEDVKAPKRRQPSFWHRPDRPDPAGQLAYARQLEADGRQRAALRQYLALVHRWHQSAEAPQAQLARAGLLERRGKLQTAFDEYQYLVDQFAGLFPHEEVLARQFAIANGFMGAGEGGALPSRASDRALRCFEQLARNAPDWTRAAEVRFRIGWLCEQDRKFEEAASAYEAVQSRYADSPFAASAAFRRGVCLQALAGRHPRDESACRDALSALASFLSRYAGSPDAKDARQRLEALRATLAEMHLDRARFYDRAGKARAAVIAYMDFLAQFGDLPSADEARARLEVVQARAKEENESK